MTRTENKMRIGILGGTFDPIHNGHIAMAESAVKELSLDRMLFIPAGNPYFKEGITPYEMRYEMTELALSGNDPEIPGAGVSSDAFKAAGGTTGIFSASRLEADEEKPTYTYLTLRALHEEYPGSRLFFLCGTDVFLSLKTWRKPEEILKEAELAVFLRNPGEADSQIGKSTAKQDAAGRSKRKEQSRRADEDVLSGAQKALKKIYAGARCHFLQTKIPPISSTQIRERVSRGEDISGLVPERVAEYIERNGLYR